MTQGDIAATSQSASNGPPAENRYYIQAHVPSADEHSRVLKQGDTFAVLDRYGDVQPGRLGEEGIFHKGTRHLSCFLVCLNGHRPLFLSSAIREDNVLLAVDLTNPDIYCDHRLDIPRGVVHLSRIKFLWRGVCYERIALRNYGLYPCKLRLDIQFASDFVDIFEVRGTQRNRRGRQLQARIEQDGVILAYEGLDSKTRRTRLTFTPRPNVITSCTSHFEFLLEPRTRTVLDCTICCESGEPVSAMCDSYDHAAELAIHVQGQREGQARVIHSSSEPFNNWVDRATADLVMMTTEMSTGPYPYAGVPWFSTPFGRDGIITALSCLCFNPGLARGVLAFLANTQARATIPEQDAEPGKILHEMRDGEMAALGEVPFGRYYGSVDATPLFVMLAGAYFERTADLDFVQSIWPNIQAAMTWIHKYGDKDGDGFVEYARDSPRGLLHQGWKDSHDAIFHADGSLASGPIALCEVQAYVYAAYESAAGLAHALGAGELADAWLSKAGVLQKRFDQAFWCPELGTCALALDGDKRPCRVRASNAGHCLLSGILRPDHAVQVAESLVSDDFFSGWGIRTVAASEAGYNPMSYHNGSVWPHDNALIAFGMARYRFKEKVLKIMSALFDTSIFLDLHRLPELLCGFDRRHGEGPTLYPVACSPQAWSAAAVFMLLQASLGLEVSSRQGSVCFCHPLLLPALREIRIHNLALDKGSVDLLLQRHGDDVGINILDRRGNVEIRMVK